MEFCIICFDPLDDEKAHHVVCVECNIDLHDECFQNWQRMDTTNTTCPHCRMELLSPTLAIVVPPPITFNLPQILQNPVPEHVNDSRQEAGRNARVSPSQEEIRVIDFSQTITTPTPRTITPRRCYYIGNYLIIFFLSGITLLQEYIVWSLKLDFEFFIIFLVTNGFLIFLGAKMVSAVPLSSPTSLESWIKYPLFTMILAYTIILSGGGGEAINVFLFLLAWIFNMNIWNFIYLITILVFKIRSSCFF